MFIYTLKILLLNTISNRMGEEGIEPSTPWSQTKIHAVERNTTVSYQARPPSHK